MKIILALLVGTLNLNVSAQSLKQQGVFEQIQFDDEACNLFMSPSIDIGFYLIPRGSRKLVIHLKSPSEPSIFDKITFVSFLGYQNDYNAIEKFEMPDGTNIEINIEGVVTDDFSLSDFVVNRYTTASEDLICTGQARLFAR
jgi:hypothetical protein